MNTNELLIEKLFPKIAEGKTILFLGAGASVTDERKYLSRELIEAYSSHAGLAYELSDLREFIDTMAADPSKSRRDFDTFVYRTLERLRPNLTHETIVQLPWREIITTNMDLLIEQAFDNIRSTAKKNLDLKFIRDIKEETYTPAPDELRYVKLNGCLSSRDRYPFVFSSKDFERSKPFYRKVLSKLKNLSPEIEFLSVGYSYSDEFAKHFLSEFDSQARAGKRRLFCVDPFVPEGRLPFFEENNIQIISMSATDFFASYRDWAEEVVQSSTARKQIRFYDVRNSRIQLPSYLLAKLGESIRPLDIHHPPQYVNPIEYYCGQEPTADVIRQDLDVVNANFLSEAISRINSVIDDDKISVPIVMLVGSFGLGKSTSLLRLVIETTAAKEQEAVAFEVVNAKSLGASALDELFGKTGAKTILLLVDKIEADSSYREFRQLHARLINEQFSDFKVVLLSSIRTNIFEKFRLSNPLPNVAVINTDRKWDEAEILELLRKLERHSLVEFMDASHRLEVARTIINEFDGDLFVCLVSIVKDSEHSKILSDAFRQLSPEGQRTLVYVSLLNQHQIPMPLGLIRSLIGISWDEVSERVLGIDFKGLVNAVEASARGTDPDLYLQIRHRRIAELIVQMQYSNEDQLYSAYREVVSKLEGNAYSATLLIDLLKAIRQKEELPQIKINALFDLAHPQFKLEPHFVIHYAMNLERRGSEDDLRKAISEIQYITSTLDDLHNDRLIHRRAVATQKLAKLMHREVGYVTAEIEGLINQAEAWFERKLRLDPQSHYSYTAYIEFELWCLSVLGEDDGTALYRRVLINTLFDMAETMLVEMNEQLHNLRLRHQSASGRNETEYLKSIEKYVESPQDRPFGLVLKYNFYSQKNDHRTCEELVNEMLPFLEIDSVAAIVLREFGSKLHIPDYRTRFWKLVNARPELETTNTILYHFYLSICNSYDRRFYDARTSVHVLKQRYGYLNEKIQDIWRDSSTGKPVEFQALIELKHGRKVAHVIDFQTWFPIRYAGRIHNLRPGDLCSVNLRFFSFGTFAVPLEILKPSE